MVRVVFAGVLASAVIALCGCSGSVVGGDGGEGGDDGAPPVAPNKPATTSPAKQCESYVSAWCTRSMNCYVKVGRLPQKDLQYNVDECKKRVGAALPCSGVRSVSGGYNQCIKDINAKACAGWDVPMDQFPFVAEPASCDELLSF